MFLIQWMGLALLGCSDQKSDEVDPDSIVKGDELCEASSAYAIPPFGLNVVMLTEDTDAPQDTGGWAGPDCGSNEKTWPCTHVTDANNDVFVNGTSYDVCFDTGKPDSCIRFKYDDHLFRDQVDTGLSSACQELVDLGDYVTGSDPNITSQSELFAALATAARDCDDPNLVRGAEEKIIDLYVMQNPYGSSGFHNWRDTTRDCGSFVFIDLDRFPDTDTGWFDQSANAHELGHAMSLAHTCYVEGAAPTEGNLMASGTDPTCCCECADDNGYDTGWVWARGDGSAGSMCADCSTAATAPATCDNSPSEWDDCAACEAGLTTESGNRNGGLSNSYWGDGTGDGVLQLDHALEGARNHWECHCNDMMLPWETSRVRSKTEAACSAGDGTFALVIEASGDGDTDDDGWMRFVPVLLSGDHMGNLAWITDAEVTDFGDYTDVFVSRADEEVSFQNSDEIDESTMYKFTSSS